MSSRLASNDVFKLVIKQANISNTLLADTVRGRQTKFLLADGDERLVDPKTVSLVFAQSKFFQAMLQSGFKEAQVSENDNEPRMIQLQNIPAEVFELLLNFARCLRLPQALEFDSAWELRSYAHYLDWDLLEVACEEFVASKINTENVCAIWTLAANHNASTLSDLAEEYFIEHFAWVVFCQNFGSLPKDLLKQVLNSGKIASDDQFVLNSLNNWARFQHMNDPNTVDQPFEPMRYIADLLPPCTLFNQRTRAAIMGTKVDLTSVLF